MMCPSSKTSSVEVVVIAAWCWVAQMRKQLLEKKEKQERDAEAARRERERCGAEMRFMLASFFIIICTAMPCTACLVVSHGHPVVRA